MAYLGNNPSTQSFTSGTDYFSGTGSQTAYTLTRTVNSVNDIEVVINNVVQQPSTAYTLSGTTITFTSAPSSGTNNIYVRYLATNMQSFTVSTNSITRTQLDSNLQAGFQGRNKIINGHMVVDQRNAGAATTPTNSTYLLDRWSYTQVAASKFTFQQNAGSVTPPAGFTNYLGATVASAVTVASGDYYNLCQPIEGFNTADLGFGTANAKTVTLSFWVRSSLIGTFGGSLRNAAGNRSYPFSYSIPVANTWTSIAVTITGDTSGTWVGATNGVGINVFFGLGVGSTLAGTAGSWQAGNYLSATGAVNPIATAGATFYITGVQLEEGTTATSFEREIYSVTLQKCQRYFEVIGASNSGPYCQDRFYSHANRIPATAQYAATKRATPTVTVYSGNGTVNNMSGYSSGTDNPVTSIASPGINIIGYFINLTNAVTQPHLGYFTVSAEL